MKKTIFVYIIFAFLLTSFAGCGKLKDSPVSGLNQTEPFAPKPKPDANVIKLVGYFVLFAIFASSTSYNLYYGD